MRRALVLTSFALGLGSHAVSAFSEATRTVATANSTATAAPCALIGQALAANATSLDADVALACLKSVPLDKSGDLKELNGLSTFLNFHSTLAYLKDPPPGYLYPPTDLQGALAKIISDLQDGHYDNDYDVHRDVGHLITSAYDFHLVWQSDILNVFSWYREESIISVSVDGTTLPNVYSLSDVAALSRPNSSHYQASPIIQMNGEDVETWLNSFAARNPWDHDPDANYNNAFFNVPSSDNNQGVGSLFSQGFVYDGPYVDWTFGNGSSRRLYTFANTNKNFTGVVDGESFFEAFCTGPPQNSYANATASASASVTPVTTENLYTPIPTAAPSNIAGTPGPNYPAPFALASDNSIGGYFPESEPDLVVISAPTFLPADSYEWQDIVRSILATAKANGKTKMILDLRANGGGIVMDGFDFFTQLFPSMVPEGLTNVAAWGLFDAIGTVVSRQVGIGNVTDVDLEPLPEFDYRQDLTSSLSQYNSWSDFFGPLYRHGGAFTNVRRYNLSSPGGLGLPIYGYINDTKPQPQTFTPDNVVVLSDAFCGSTCAVFAEFLKTQAGVQAISVGGRKQYGPMQWVGGSKGANDQEAYDLNFLAEHASHSANATERHLFEPYLQDNLTDNARQMLRRVQVSSDDDNPVFNINFQNNLRQGDTTYTPLQFVYEAADCRFFYTAEMLQSQELVWKQAYNLKWGNATCVQGSTGQPSSVTGDNTTYIESPAPPSASNRFRANETFSYPGAWSSGVSYSMSAAPTVTSSNTASATTSVRATSTAGGTTETVVPSQGGAASLATAGPLVSVVAGILLSLSIF